MPKFTEDELNDALRTIKLRLDIGEVAHTRYCRDFDNCTRVATKIYQYCSVVRLHYSEVLSLSVLFSGRDSFYSFMNRTAIMKPIKLAILETEVDRLLNTIADGVHPQSVFPERYVD